MSPTAATEAHFAPAREWYAANEERDGREDNTDVHLQDELGVGPIRGGLQHLLLCQQLLLFGNLRRWFLLEPLGIEEAVQVVASDVRAEIDLLVFVTIMRDGHDGPATWNVLHRHPLIFFGLSAFQELLELRVFVQGSPTAADDVGGHLGRFVRRNGD